MKKFLMTLVIAGLLLGSVGCANSGDESVSSADNSNEVVKQEKLNIENENYIKYVDENDIIRDTSKLGKKYSKYYSKYINYIAPNGKPILIVAADKVSDEQVLKAYNILKFYLTDTKLYDKTAIANAMADNDAVLNMPNGADGDGKTSDKALMGQPLYQMEVPVAGSKWYQESDYEHRDAAYEEIFHMVHDMGIGTTQNPSAYPKISKQIKEGMDKALPKNKADWGKKGIWGLESRDWLLELSKEGSLEQEYIVSGIDSFYGLWEAFDERDRGMWGIYIPKNREAVKQMDKPAYDIIMSFLGENLTYMERIAPEFDGTFKMSLSEKEPYTFKSQYLQNARLTGDKNSNLEGNALDNILLGNKGNNIIDGKHGNDVVQFSGESSEYTIAKDGENILVKDTNLRDGEDTLIHIEVLRFMDKDLIVSEIK